MESSPFGGWSNTQINMRWERRGSRRYSWGCEGSAWRVRDRVFDKEGNSATRMMLRFIKPEVGVTRERN